MTIEYTKAGWPIAEWGRDVGVSRSTTYELLGAGRIKSVKLGAKRLITTSPRDFLASLEGPSDHPEAPGHYYRSNEPEAA